jgi:DNA-binding XRE family transcriptional regulator
MALDILGEDDLDGEWGWHEEAGEVWLSNRVPAWQARWQKIYEILESKPDRGELEELATVLLTAARKLDPAPNPPGRPAGRRVNASRLRHLRKTAGFSQDEFSDECGIALSTVQRAEHGIPVGESSIETMADALGLAPSGLYL